MGELLIIHLGLRLWEFGSADELLTIRKISIFLVEANFLRNGIS